MPRVPLTDGPDDFYALLGRRPEIKEAWQGLDSAMMGPGSTLTPSLKENVRRALSQGVGCRYCASFGEPSEQPRDRKESLALGFVELVVKDHEAIDDSTFEVLREEFTDDQILELCAWISFKFGANMLGSLTKLEPARDDQKATYEGWLEEREQEMVTAVQ
jgi:alkylhydroperoxidase family enzyme